LVEDGSLTEDQIVKLDALAVDVLWVKSITDYT